MTEKLKPQSSFRESISQAPEFTKPFIANTLLRETQEWPFQEVKLDKEFLQKKAVFEARNPVVKDMEDRRPTFVRVSYEEPYGLKAKRTIILGKFSDSELLMQAGEIEYNFGDISIVIAANLRSPFVTDDIVSNSENFNPAVSVVGDKSTPPIAYIEYYSNSRIPIYAQFPCADFQEALKGEVEKRGEDVSLGPSYKNTYFQWEELIGAKVGIAKYDDPANPDRLQYYRWITKINNPEPVQLEDSLYKEKISRSESRWGWGSGRLRFSRINSQTGESWMFSVPEWISKYDFHRDIQHASLINFFSKYPVVFCVKKRGEEKKWFSTCFRRDSVR